MLVEIREGLLEVNLVVVAAAWVAEGLAPALRVHLEAASNPPPPSPAEMLGLQVHLEAANQQPSPAEMLGLQVHLEAANQQPSPADMLGELRLLRAPSLTVRVDGI